MEQITIQVSTTGMVVVDGKVSGSRLTFTAPGLEIYKTGKLCICRRDAFNHVAMEAALARHISLRSLVKHGGI